MIKPHLLYICSPDKEKHIKLSLESFEKFSRTDFHSTLIINTPEQGNWKGNFHINRDWTKDLEIIFDDSHYKDHPPTRWSVEPRSEVCIFIDHDIVVRSDIRPLVEICKQTNSICGVIAYNCKIKNSLFRKAFEECGVPYIKRKKTWIGKIPIPKYYNYGVLAVPSTWLKVIHDPLSDNIKIINRLSKETQDYYLCKHGGQVALAITLEQLNVPTIDLDIKYNYPNTKNIYSKQTTICNHPSIYSRFKPYPEEVVFEHILDKSIFYAAKFS